MKKLWLCGTVGVFVAGTAMAQSSPQTGSLQAGSAAVTESNGERDPARVEADPGTPAGDIVITGSRIPRAGFDTLEPAITVSTEQLQNRSATNVGDVLRTVPGFSLGQTPIGAQSDVSPGATYVDRFGLGSARTLTLVNGRRVVSTNPPSTQNGQTPGAQVDLNIISPMLVERIENLAIGGAPTYGTDAISGVVNIILRKNYSGVMATAQLGLTEEGDNFERTFSGLAGQNFADGRGNVMVAASYSRSGGAGFRDWQRDQTVFAANPLATSAAALLPGRTASTDGRVNPDVPFNTGPSDGIPNAVLIHNYTIPAVSRGGVIVPVGRLQQASFIPVGFGPTGQTLIQFGANGDIVPYNPGNPFAPTFASGGDGYRNAISNVAAETERKTVNVNASYELTSNISAFFEGTFFNGGGRTNNATAHYFSRYFGGPTVTMGPILVSITDPRLTPSSVATLQSLGVTNFEVSKVSEEIGQHDAATDNTVYRAVAGLNGTFGALGRTFRFDASFNYGRTEGRAYRTDVIQQNFVNAMNVRRDASGTIVCDPNPVQLVTPGAVRPVADAACVPLNLFGIDQASPAALAYVNARAVARSRLEQTDILVNVGSSDLFSIFGANPVGFSAGLEYRKESGEFIPDALQAAGLTQESVVTGVKGQVETKEVFGEVLIPLISPSERIPLIDTLEFEGRARYVDNSLTQGFTAYTFGGRYRPVPDIEFRGNYTRSLRAPSIAELFSPQSVSVGQFPDPCDARNLTVGPNPAIRQRNCAAFYSSYGITNPTAFFSTANGVGIPVLIGGNPKLQNEAATSYTFGVVLRPSFLPKFRAAIDWNRILLKGNIASLTSTNIAQGCYDNPDFNAASPDAGNYFCTLFTRSRGGQQNGQLVIDPKNPGLTNLFVNGAFVKFQGLTAEVSYRDLPIEMGPITGSLTFDTTFFYLDKLCSSNNAVTTVCLEGTVPQPKYSSQVNVTYAQDRFTFNVEANYRSSTKFDLLFTGENQDFLTRKSQVLYNLGASYRIAERTQLRGSVTNLLNSRPPYPYVPFTTAVGDLLGRRFAIALTQSF